MPHRELLDKLEEKYKKKQGASRGGSALLLPLVVAMCRSLVTTAARASTRTTAVVVAVPPLATTAEHGEQFGQAIGYSEHLEARVRRLGLRRQLEDTPVIGDSDTLGPGQVEVQLEDRPEQVVEILELVFQQLGLGIESRVVLVGVIRRVGVQIVGVVLAHQPIQLIGLLDDQDAQLEQLLIRPADELVVLSGLDVRLLRHDRDDAGVFEIDSLELFHQFFEHAILLVLVCGGSLPTMATC